MNNTLGMILSLLLGLALALAGSDALAARMGGGKSFGSRPSYSEPYQRSAPGYGQPGFGRQGTAQQPAFSQAQQRNQAARDALAQRGGLSRFLGGLALGGLLGALFFGGAFEHLNLFDILIFAAIAFMLFKLFAARRQGTAAPAGYDPGGRNGGLDQPYQRQPSATSGPAGFNTDLLARKGGGSAASEPGAASRSGPAVPADFDAAVFLSGAKAAYSMLQKAWDEGDLVELRALTTDKVFGELQDQLRARGGASNRTDLLQVEAELLEVRDVGSDREATVLFDVLMRESPDARPAQVREVWHFTRSRNSRQPTWFLDGIQQVED
jgi:predicted lipid-binding transport protein (Tim44 family)